MTAALEHSWIKTASDVNTAVSAIQVSEGREVFLHGFRVTYDSAVPTGLCRISNGSDIGNFYVNRGWSVTFDPPLSFGVGNPGSVILAAGGVGITGTVTAWGHRT